MKLSARCADEHVVHDDVVAAAATQADGVPHVVDAVVAQRQQVGAEVHGLARRVVGGPADERPPRVVAAGGEAPPPGQPVPAVDERRLAHRRVRRGDQRVGVRAPHVVLRLLREQREVPGVHPDDGGDPARRAARAADQLDRGVEVDRVGFGAAVAGRLQQLEEAGLLQRLDRLLGDLAGVLRLLRALAQIREQLPHPVDDLPAVLVTHPCAPVSSCTARARRATRSADESMDRSGTTVVEPLLRGSRRCSNTRTCSRFCRQPRRATVANSRVKDSCDQPRGASGPALRGASGQRQDSARSSRASWMSWSSWPPTRSRSPARTSSAAASTP